MTKIIKCSCNHTYQDKKYGVGNRVHNSGKVHWRCTICKKEKE